MEHKNYISKLPSDVFLEIFSFFNKGEQGRAAIVNKQFNQLAKHQKLSNLPWPPRDYSAPIKSCQNFENAQAYCFTTLPNENYLVCGNYRERKLQLWDIAQMKLVKEFQPNHHNRAISALVALSNDKVVIGFFDGGIEIWDINSTQCQVTLSADLDDDLDKWVRQLGISPNNHLICASNNGRLKIWDLTLSDISQDNHQTIIIPDEDSIHTFAILSNNLIVGGTALGKIQVWDINEGICQQNFQAHAESITSIIALNDTCLLTSSIDKTLKVWDITNNQCLQTFNGHTNGVTRAIYLPNGYIISGSHDQTLKIWDITQLEQNECFQTLATHTSTIRALAVLPDGQIISGADDGMKLCKFPELKFNTDNHVHYRVHP